VSEQPIKAENPESHLQHLLPPSSLETPFYKSLIQGIKELIHPPELPPLEVTSKPYYEKGLEGLYSGNEWKSGATGILINLTVVALLIFLSTLKPVQRAIQAVIPLTAPVMEHKPAPKKEISKGGGGSPDKAVTQAKLPKVAPKQFAPPKVPIENPKLTYSPSIVAPDLPNVASVNYGDPLAGIGLPGTGNGIGKGIGSGRGNGVGPGSGGGIGGGAYKIGGGVSAPKPTFQPEPEYSEEARKAKWTGSVRLSIVVDEKGIPQEIKVVKPLGLGLDEKAIEAVQKWRFLPGQKDGKPVPVEAIIDVTFHLL